MIVYFQPRSFTLGHDRILYMIVCFIFHDRLFDQSFFQLDRSEDESFQDEKRFLIKSIRELREPERPAGSSSIQPAPE